MVNDGRAPINVTHDDDLDDGIQHGIDDNPHNDAAKGAITGGIGAGTMGAIAGSMLGPAGAVAGALIGGAIGAAASGAAVAAIDRHDNDNNITGLGDDIARDHDDDFDDETGYATGGDTGFGTGTVYPAHTVGSATGAAPMGTMTDPVVARDEFYDNRDRVTTDYTSGSTLGSTSLTDDRRDTGLFDDPNRTRDLDTRGITEKAADAVTGDRIDDNTGRVVR